MAVGEWREDDRGEPEAVLKHRYRVIEDDENAGLYTDDEGQLVASVVGAPEFDNERVCFSLMTEYHSEDGVEVRDLSIIDAV